MASPDVELSDCEQGQAGDSEGIAVGIGEPSPAQEEEAQGPLPPRWAQDVFEAAERRRAET